MWYTTMRPPQFEVYKLVSLQTFFMLISFKIYWSELESNQTKIII